MVENDDSDSGMEVDAEGVQDEFDDGRNIDELDDERSKRRRLELFRKARDWAQHELKGRLECDANPSPVASGVCGAIVVRADRPAGETTPRLQQLCAKDLLKAMTEMMDEKAGTRVERVDREIRRTQRRSFGQSIVDIAELYSPPRMATMATMLGFKP